MNIPKALKEYWGVAAILLLTPLLLYAVLPILPTHDDWAGTTKPDFTDFFIKEHFFFYGYHWRPFDTWIGYIAGRNPQLLYPTFNHILVVVGHLLCSLCVYKLLGVLRFGQTACNIATLCFFVVPATMATVTAIDSQNQVYALTFGILSFLSYIRQNRYKYLAWPVMVFIATLCKENGLMWALISPVLAFGFDFIDKKTLKRDLLIGIAVMAFYFFAITILPKDIIIHPEYEPGMDKIVKNVMKFLMTTFFTFDYLYLLHQPSQNLLLASISILLTLPFLHTLFFRPWRHFLHKKVICTVLCLVIAVGPHLLTIFSMMHTYAGLGMIAILTAYSIDSYKQRLKPVIITLLPFLVAAIAIDCHLIDASVQSGLVGKQMAQEAVRKTGKPVDNVMVVIIEDDYPKLSSFCVIPCEAFGWGWASRYETNYKWPENIQDTTIARTPRAMSEAQSISRRVLQGKQADCVWIVDHKKIYVVKE